MWLIIKYITILCNKFKILFYNLLFFNHLRIGFLSYISNLKIRINSNSCKIYIGQKVYFRTNCIINMSNGGYLSIGDNTFLNDFVLINVRKKINIGKNVCIGQGTKLYDHDHCYGEKIGFKEKEIIIGDNTWIGANVIILRGTVIGKNCVIGAGTIVKTNLPDNTILVNKKKDILRRVNNV